MPRVNAHYPAVTSLSLPDREDFLGVDIQPYQTTKFVFIAKFREVDLNGIPTGKIIETDQTVTDLWPTTNDVRLAALAKVRSAGLTDGDPV